MAEEELSRKLLRDWVRRRADAVREKYSAFDALMELGVEGLVDDSTPISVFCPFHHNTKTAAGRYYPASGRRPGYLRCFGCRENWDSINLVAKARGKRFMDALVELERRYRIQIPKRPETPAYVEPADRNSDYESEQWADIPRVIHLMESKLRRIRDKCGLPDFTKFCRVIDAVSYDFDLMGKSHPDMVKVLRKTMTLMDEAMILSDIQVTHDDLPI